MEERVQKIIAAAGIASRRAAEQLMLDGRVKVNGAVVTELGTKADAEKDHIKVDGKLINPQQPKTYVMLNKPVGYVTTMSDPEGRPVVSDLLKGVRVRVYPVGRLDYDTEGLLLLTNDGDLAHLVTHPRHELPKTYLVKVKGVLEDRDVENLERGVFLKDGRTAPARVRRLRKEEANSWVEITIHEGRKRQVRRMIDHTGRSVIKLKRMRIGSLDLGDLALGAYRHLTAEEVRELREEAQGELPMTTGETVDVPSGPAGAKRLLTFIEGPKPKERARAAAAPRQRAGEQRSAKKAFGGKPFRGRQAGGRSGEARSFRPEKRDERPAGKYPRRPEKRFDKAAFGGRNDRPGGGRPWSEKDSERRTSGGPAGSFGDRDARRGGEYKPRTVGKDRPFAGRPSSQERTGRRPAGTRPWGEQRSGSPSFGGRSSRPDERSGARRGPDRPFKSGFSRPDGRSGARRDSDRPFGSKGSRPDDRSGARRDSDRPFNSRSSRPDSWSAQRGSTARPFGAGSSTKREGKRPWSAADRTPRPGSAYSRSRTDERRSSGTRTGGPRPGSSRDRKGRGPGRA